jgi:hypothetical protein
MLKDPVYKCYKCSEELVFDVKIGRRDQCPNCHAYLHCCFNCRFWDPHVHNECTENRSEFIRDRAEGNFCLYFTFREADTSGDGEQLDSKAKLNLLFGDIGPGVRGASPKSRDEARSRLDALFKK